MADATPRQLLERKLEGLKLERNHYEPGWRTYDELVMPGRLRLVEREGKGKAKDQKIFDDTVRNCYGTCVAGIQGGLTSPARPWFRTTTADPDLREVGPVKDYLWQAETRMRQIMQSSNLYNVIQKARGDLIQFGQGVYLLIGDDDAVFRAIALQTGQYWIGQNHHGRVDTLFRYIQMTVRQVVERFVKQPDGQEDWSVVSQNIRNLWDKSSYQEWITIGHAIEPRKDRDVRKQDKRNKPIASCYWEHGSTTGVMLEESGFNINPIMASRWETNGEDVYGCGHPAEMSVASIKMLMAEQLDKGMAIKMKVRPPMTGPTSLRNQPSSTLPGSITYTDSNGPHNTYRPAIDVNVDISHLLEDINDVRKQIKLSWFEPLFMAISQMEGIQPKNVFELTQRKEEQLLRLGPIIDRDRYEHLDPLIDGVFHHCAEAGMFPEPPKEIEGQPLQIEHISILAQAQRAVATGSIERVFSFAGNLAGLKPTIIDKLDFDQAVDEYADMVGAPPRVIRSDDDVKQERDQRAKQEQAAANAEMASKVAPAVQQSAQAAKLLAETGTIQGDGELVNNQELLAKLGIVG